jgi:hypothetical protein
MSSRTEKSKFFGKKSSPIPSTLYVWMFFLDAQILLHERRRAGGGGFGLFRGH